MTAPQMDEAKNALQQTLGSLHTTYSLAGVEKLVLAFKIDDNLGPEDRPILDFAHSDCVYFQNTIKGVQSLRDLCATPCSPTCEEVESLRSLVLQQIDARLEEFAEFERKQFKARFHQHKLRDDVAKTFGLENADNQFQSTFSVPLHHHLTYAQTHVTATLGPPSSATRLKINIIHFCALFIVSILTTVCHLSDKHAQFTLQALHGMVAITFMLAQTPSAVKDPILNHWPKTLGNSAELFGYSITLIIYVVCPVCSACYELDNPQDLSSVRPYCTALIGESMCGAPLLETFKRGWKSYTRPIRVFPVRSIAGWIGGLMELCGVEALIDSALPINKEAGGIWDVWNAGFVQTFAGPGQILFTQTVGNLLLALAVDWLNPHGNLTAKKQVSVGAIYIICLNIPLHLRSLLEHICLIAVMPGEHEPDYIAVHHFWKIIVGQLKRLWEIGVWVKTTRFPDGRLIKVAVGIVIADLVALKKSLGFVDSSSTMFCHFCKCTNRLRDIFSLSFIHSLRRTMEEHRNVLRALEEAPSTAARAAITQKTGIRQSAFNDLPYFRAHEHAALDQLHMFSRMIDQYFRGALNSNDKFPSSVYPPAVPDWKTNSVQKLSEGEFTMLTGSEAALGRLDIPVLQELCWRRGINWYREKAPMVRDLQDWVCTQTVQLEPYIDKL